MGAINMMPILQEVAAQLTGSGPCRRMAKPKPTGRDRDDWHSDARLEAARRKRNRKKTNRQRQYDRATGADRELLEIPKFLRRGEG